MNEFIAFFARAMMFLACIQVDSWVARYESPATGARDAA